MRRASTKLSGWLLAIVVLPWRVVAVGGRAQGARASQAVRSRSRVLSLGATVGQGLPMRASEIVAGVCLRSFFRDEFIRKNPYKKVIL